MLTRKGATVYDRAGKPVERPRVKSVASSLLVDKGNHRHFMAKEIHEQPEVISHTLANYIDFSQGRVSLPDLGVDPAELSRISISACGTAYYAGLVGKYWFERYARIPVEIDIASEFRYREPPMAEGGLAIFVSQSGETADTLASLRYCKAKGQTHCLHRQRADLHHRARVRRHSPDPCRARDRRGFDQGVDLPAQRAGLPGDRAGARAASSSEAKEQELVRCAGARCRATSRRFCAAKPAREDRPQALEGADVLYLGRGVSYPSRWKARSS